MSWQAFKIITFIIIVIIIITADLPFGPHQYIHIWHHTAALGQSGTAANIHISALHKSLTRSGYISALSQA